MDCPRLMLVTNQARTARPLDTLVEAAVDGGVDAVQVRAPELSADARRDLVSTLLPICRERALLLVNNDERLASDLQIGWHGPEGARRSPNLDLPYVTQSVHTPAAASRAKGYDALVVGHVFQSASKPGLPPLGIDGLRAIVAATQIPVIAIGGVTHRNAACCIDAGARGVAVIGAICEANEPGKAARRLRSAVDQALARTAHPETKEAKMNTSTTPTEVNISLNGKPASIDREFSVLDLLRAKELRPELVAVEYNRTILRREQFEATQLQDGDQVEIVHFVGGG